MTILSQKNIQYSEVYRDYYPLVNGSIFTKVNHREDTDDLTQDVFLDLYNSIEEVKNIRTWLFSTVKNKLYDYYRSKKKMSEKEAKEEVSGDIDITIINGFMDARIVIKEAVESITDETDRLIFDLIAVQFYSYEEAGEVLGFGIGKVRYRYDRIVKGILIFLKEQKGINKLEDLI
ncbi:MAG: sigma-70 family RNA polymerase sigma factor [bacterium]|nr:sigma-70 family RNA polymerase sigma factor [bacterium]